MEESKRIQDEDIPIRNPSVTVYDVGDDAVLHDPERDQVFAVNPLARDVWTRCDGITPLTSIGRAIGRRVEVSPHRVIDRLKHIVSDLEAQNLLFVPRTELDTRARRSPVHIKFGPHQVQVETTDAQFATALRRRFRELLGEASGGEVLDRFHVQELEGGYRVRGSRGRVTRENSLPGAVQSLKHEIVRRFMEARPDLIWLHAGAAARDDAAVLLVGEWGSGKSTVVTELYRAGWSYLSDDVVPYDPESARIFPFPLTPAYRRTQTKQLSKQELSGVTKEDVSLDPENVQGGPAHVRGILFPAFEPDSPAERKECGSAEAVVALMRNCQNARRYQGDPIQELCRLAGRVPTFRLQYDSRSSILGLLKEFDKTPQNTIDEK